MMKRFSIGVLCILMLFATVTFSHARGCKVEKPVMPWEGMTGQVISIDTVEGGDDDVTVFVKENNIGNVVVHTKGPAFVMNGLYVRYDRGILVVINEK